MSFNPSTLVVHAGQPVQLTLQNTGVMPHDFTLTDGVTESVKISASGGQTSQRCVHYRVTWNIRI